jgi:hypothetical protein
MQFMIRSDLGTMKTSLNDDWALFFAFFEGGTPPPLLTPLRPPPFPTLPVQAATSVTRLGEFSPIGRLITLGNYFEIYRSSPNLWGTFSK